MLSIRLRRAGTTKKPHYRVVVADSRDWRDGRFVEVLGHYDPRRSPAVVKIDAERARYWIGKGARPSETVRSLLKQSAAGGSGGAVSPPLDEGARDSLPRDRKAAGS
jgi:small subunit ribosomal protein S16